MKIRKTQTIKTKDSNVPTITQLPRPKKNSKKVIESKPLSRLIPKKS